MKHQPPKSARQFFEWVCGHAYVQDLLGDLDEWFLLNQQRHSLFRARLLYWGQVVSLCFSYGLRKRKRDARSGMYSTSYLSMDMFYNYLKVALRNLSQHKYFSLLNVLGLAIGMSVSLILIALVSYVKTYDNFHEHRDHIYTLTSQRLEGVEQREYATAPVLLAETLAPHPDVRQVVRIRAGFNETVRQARGGLPLRGYYVEPNFLEVFSYVVTHGHAAAALAQPNHVVLTESAAKRIFNSTDVLGKTLEMEAGGVFEIGAVMKDHPINSHLKFEVLVSYATLPEPLSSRQDQWMNYGREYVYVLVREGAETSRLQTVLDQLAQRTYHGLPIQVSFDLQHLHDITMGPDYRQAIGPKWEMSGMLVFMVIAALILLPACFNYANISLARALKRAKEIGLRKTMGGLQHQIVIQFMAETVVITCAALGVGILIFWVTRSEFQSMMAASSSLDLRLTPRILGWFFVFALGTGLLAGVFPALFFGRLNPIQALKNNVHGRSSAMRVRKGLTVIQFTLSFGFILALVVFTRQYRYSVGFDFGFDKANIVNVSLQGADPDQVRNELAQLASVEQITLASHVLGLGYSQTWIKDSDKDSVEVAQVFVDANYLETFKLTLLAGKSFPDDPWQRERAIVINEEFLRAYNIAQPSEALGRIFDVEGAQLEVIGVVKNFHFATLRLPIGKFFFRQHPQRYLYAHLRVRSDDPYTLFSQLESHWKNVSDRPLDARFFEHDVEEAYSMYQTLIKIIGFLGVLALSISLLGMLGMVVYTSETRVKEVGVRKVMGASVWGLIFLLSRDYLRLMLVAVLLGAPATALLLGYLMPFIQYYSVSLNGWDVLIATAVLVGLGLATIASQTYRTAMTNPAETLRTE